MGVWGAVALHHLHPHVSLPPPPYVSSNQDKCEHRHLSVSQTGRYPLLLVFHDSGHQTQQTTWLLAADKIEKTPDWHYICANSIGRKKNQNQPDQPSRSKEWTTIDVHAL